MQRIRVEPRNPVSLFEGASLSIFAQVFCCQAEVFSWFANDKLHPALSGEISQLSSCLHSLGVLLPLKCVIVDVSVCMCGAGDLQA